MSGLLCAAQEASRAGSVFFGERSGRAGGRGKPGAAWVEHRALRTAGRELQPVLELLVQEAGMAPGTVAQLAPCRSHPRRTTAQAHGSVQCNSALLKKKCQQSQALCRTQKGERFAPAIYM